MSDSAIGLADDETGQLHTVIERRGWKQNCGHSPSPISMSGASADSSPAANLRDDTCVPISLTVLYTITEIPILKIAIVEWSVIHGEKF